MNGLWLASIRRRTERVSSSEKRLYRSALLVLLPWLIPWTLAIAAPLLKDVEYAARPGNQVHIEPRLSEAVEPPQALTDNPARIVLDLAGVRSGLAGKRIPIDIGPVRSLAAAESADRTRVVIDLGNPVSYRIDTDADKIKITLRVPPAKAAPSKSPSGSTADRSRSRSAVPNAGVGTVKSFPLQSPGRKDRGRRGAKHAGDRISLHFQDIEVRAVLQLLADFTGLNLVASNTVAGNITLRLKDIPWEQALDIILKAKGLLTALLKSKENQLLSERGKVTFDERTNTLLV